MNILILTEGGENIGFGHVTRCLSLYQAFKKHGFTVTFMVKGDESVSTVLGDTPFTLCDWTAGTATLDKAAANTDAVVVDSYLAPIEIYNHISQTTPRPLFLDDTRRLDYPPGTVLNWSICAPHLGYPEKTGVSYLLGPGYISLRQPFLQIPQRKFNPQVKTIMITFGGDDSKNLTPKILSFLCHHYPHLQKKVVIGSAFTNQSQVQAAADENTELLHTLDAEGMKNLMLTSDIAISSGGQTLYELARTGTPPVVITVADNQKDNVNHWNKSHFIEYAGTWTDENLMPHTAGALEHLLENKRRQEAASIGQDIVKATGTENIIEYLKSMPPAALRGLSEGQGAAPPGPPIGENC